MELKILWMYHNIKDVFGDAGNIQTIKKRLAIRGMNCIVDTCDIGEERILTSYDLIYIGTNVNYQDTYIYEDLLKRRDEIVKAIDKQIVFLLVCGGFQLFGDHTVDAQGNMHPMLKIFSYYSDYRNHVSFIQDICVESELVHQRILGFENHEYQIIGVEKALGQVIRGNGNCLDNKDEGFHKDSVYATNIHGPLLPKNPELADRIIEKALSRTYPHVLIEPLEDRFEEKAREVILSRWNMHD